MTDVDPFLLRRFLNYRTFSQLSVSESQSCASHHSIRIVLLSRYVNIYDTMAPMSDLGLTPKAKKCESMIKKAMMLMKENYQPEPGAGARCPRGPS